jgi:hypothetical protein
MTTKRNVLAVSVLAAGAVAGAATHPAGPSPQAADARGERVSRPAYVSKDCRAPGNARACAVALRYLEALDLDRAGEACGLLERSTLEAAGGMPGCAAILRRTRGVRIRYSVHQVLRSPLGRTVRFSTRGGSSAPVYQQMLVSQTGKIVAVVPEP